MSPEEFIKKHITEALAGEGFPAEVARGGQSMVLIITGDALSPAGREACTLIVFSVRDSGLLGRRQQQNARQRKGREGTESANPACSDFVCISAE